MSKVLKGGRAQPLRILKAPGKDGAFTTNEAEIDQIARDAWDEVYKGNVENIDLMVQNFLGKYDRHVHKAPRFHVQQLKWQDIKRECMKDTDFAGGLDVWKKRELYWVSDEAFKWLAQWMNKVEDLRRWPETQTKARAVFLCKDEDVQCNPMAYLILKITSTLYRVWASARMADLEEWVQSWSDDPMFAGVPGAGAEEGWYLTQLDFEFKRLASMQITAGSVDVYKCFDQMVRALIVWLADEAGMLEQILETSSDFVDKLGIRMQIGASIGVEHHHRCSIPQGCPFSMALLSPVMRVWIRLMREIGVAPRTLADDLFFYAAGPGHRAKAENAMEASKTFFEDIGAKVADGKCFMTSTCQETRNTMRKAGDGIRIVNHFRDLGSHVCLDNTRTAVTLTKRIRKATNMVQKLRRLPISKAKKIRISETNILGNALYGSETSHISSKAMKEL